MNGAQHVNNKIIHTNKIISQNITTKIALVRNRQNETYYLFPSPLHVACSDPTVAIFQRKLDLI